MPTISDFAARFGGGVRPNLFRVQINGAPEFFQDIDFLCKATTIPASTIGKVEVPFRGRKLQVPGDRTFEDWNITLLNDTAWQNRSSIEAWMGRMQAHTANYADIDDLSHYGQASVSQLDRQNNIIRTYRMECFPTSAAAITLDADTNDSVEEFEVTFAINYFTIDGSGSDGVQAGSSADIDVSGNINLQVGGVQVQTNF
jgi:hypothetical protein|tara:strand:- start:40 stop:639 length:600 start_codon:yes stop_codon:yes gene_type:complete